jgi:hypothetical protein
LELLLTNVRFLVSLLRLLRRLRSCGNWRQFLCLARLYQLSTHRQPQQLLCNSCNQFRRFYPKQYFHVSHYSLFGQVFG